MEIGQNIGHTREEQEEDLLELLYSWWKEGKELTIPEVSKEGELTRREVKSLLKEMAQKGYLEPGNKPEEIRLSDLGKSQGAECLSRHRNLTEFLQLICGLEEREAEEDACRIEHVISQKAVRGISDFLKFGDTYDRVIRDTDLHFMYPEGVYKFCMGIYCAQRRYPRILAKEFYSFQEQVELEIGKEESFFYLQPREKGYREKLWYKGNTGWEQAGVTERGFRIPARALAFTVSPEDPVTEGEGILFFGDKKLEAEEKDYKELNIHIW